MSTVTTPGLNLWSSSPANAILKGANFNDVLHAVHNGTTMTGGLGKDHFHVNMTPTNLVTGTKITDFNASQSDRLVLDGITNFDAANVTVFAKGNDYEVRYLGNLVATVNLQYTNAQGQVVDWNPDLAQATAAITKMVRGGQAEAGSDYLYGTDSAQTFQYNGRKLNIVGFDPALDSIGLGILSSFNGLAASIEGTGLDRYVSLKGFGGEYLNVKLREVTDANLQATLNKINTELAV